MPTENASSSRKTPAIARSYALVIASVAACALVRYLLNPIFGSHVAFLLFFPALVFSAWVGGWGGGLLALALSAVTASLLFLGHASGLPSYSHTDEATLVIFLIVGMAVSAICSSQRKARQEAEQAAEAARRSALALAKSEARYRLLLETASEGVVLTDETDIIRYANPRVLEMVGYGADELVGCPLLDLVFGDDKTAALKRRQERRQGISEQYEQRLRHCDGREVWVMGSVSPIIEADKYAGTFSLFTDITERHALEEQRERLALREHNIAQQLQEALQPAIPMRMPGLDLAEHYRPALEEAGVGGDFADVFSAGDVTFLTVGDLAGKGLAAASQVATVRNMLRFALYNGRSLAGPITSLNRILVQHELLTGFATLFVARYDAQTQTLSYVNCGQDAGLIRRAATGEVEALPPTGSVLGAFDAGDFEEQDVRLYPGDIVAVYTDGLTEAGPTRDALLGGDGVADLLRTMPSGLSGSAMVNHLIAGVDAHAQGGIQDDQCLLVGIVEPAPMTYASA